MTDDRNPEQKQPGEKQPGKYHYNPGNMSGKTAEKIDKDEVEQLVEEKVAETGKARPSGGS